MPLAWAQANRVRWAPCLQGHPTSKIRARYKRTRDQQVTVTKLNNGSEEWNRPFETAERTIEPENFWRVVVSDRALQNRVKVERSKDQPTLRWPEEGYLFLAWLRQASLKTLESNVRAIAEAWGSGRILAGLSKDQNPSNDRDFQRCSQAFQQDLLFRASGQTQEWKEPIEEKNERH